MLDRLYKLKFRLNGLVFLPKGGAMGEATIPARSIVKVLSTPVGRVELTSIRYGDGSCKLQIDALKKRGVSIEPVAD